MTAKAAGQHGEGIPPSVRRVLIIKPSSLGDVVSAVGVLRGLRRALPGAHIAWLAATTHAPILEGDPDLSELITYDRRQLGAFWRSLSAWRAVRGLCRRLRDERFDWAIDLQGLFRSGWFTRATRAPLRAGFADAREGAARFYNHAVAVKAVHAVDRNHELAAALGIDVRPEDMRLHVSPAGARFAEEFLRGQSLHGGDYVVFVPFTRGAVKNYPPRRWREVIAQLRGEVRIVLAGAPADAPAAAAIAEGAGDPEAPRVSEGTNGGIINLVGQTSIPQLVGLLSRSAGIVCGDSAAQYIAPAVGVPVVALLGPTRVERTGPYRLGRAIVANVPCQGCLQRSCRHVTCMESIPAASVTAAVREMVAGRGLPHSV